MKCAINYTLSADFKAVKINVDAKNSIKYPCASTESDSMQGFEHITHWALDMDGTVYDARQYVFPKFWDTFASYIAQHVPELLGRDHKEVFADYTAQHGLISRAFVAKHGVDIDHFLKHLHDFDLSPVTPDTRTQAGLARLPGEKIIFTDAPRDFAARMTRHLGLTPHLKDIFALEDSGYAGKLEPDTFRIFIETHKLDPKTVCMVEDTAANLVTAHALGMTTVLLHGDRPVASGPHIHHTAPTINEFMERLMGPLVQPAPFMVPPPAPGSGLRK